jgi:hypothetical protein
VLAAQAPDLHEALQRAKTEGASHIVLDDKLFSSDRLGEHTTSVKGTQIDAWYSGKAHERKIGDIVKAALVLAHFEHGRLT